jgi:hypothetical protein
MAESGVPDSARSLHEQNKREAFDGMRAYHQSEIAHKGHTVEVIKTLLTVIVTAYGGLIWLIGTNKISRCQAITVAILFLPAVAAVVLHVIYATNRKIDKDHDSYESHRAEYIAERFLLEIDSHFCCKYKTHWQPRPKDAATGYSYTKRLNWALGGIILAAAAIGSALAILASFNK